MDPRRLGSCHHHVPEPEVAVHDGLRQSRRHGVREPGADVLDLRDLPRLVDLPELREAPHLPLVVAPGTRERREPGTAHVGGVDLDERVDQVVAEAAARRLALEPGR